MPVFVMLVTLVTLPQPQERVLCVVQANTLVVLQTLFVFAQTVALDNFQQRLERLLLILVRIAQRTRQRLEEAKGHFQTVFAMLVTLTTLPHQRVLCAVQANTLMIL